MVKKLIFSIVLINILQNLNEANSLLADPIKLIEKYGYPVESHQVTTEDGYILEMYRIPRGINDPSSNKNKTPKAVLLMHGMIATCVNFIDFGPNRSSGFMFYEQGYDVWLGNSRGNEFSNKHISLDPQSNANQYFDFNFEELAIYDLPAMIDYILKVTKQDKIHYVGHSQGASIFLILASLKPEYNKKIRLATLYGPVGIMESPPYGLAHVLSNYIELLEFTLNYFNLPIISFADFARTRLHSFCSKKENHETCLQIVWFFLGFEDNEQFDVERFNVFFTHMPATGSNKQIYHSAQFLQTGRYARYNYGKSKNLQVYGSELPPLYNLSLITAPVAIFYAKNDRWVSISDCQKMKDKLPNVVEFHLVPYEKFNHMDFVIATDIQELLLKQVFKTMAKFDEND